MREWAITIAIAGALFALIFGVVTHGTFRAPPWPESPPDMSAWNTCWRFTPQPDITAPELATILKNGGVGTLGVKKDDPSFEPLKRHFTQFDCPGR